MHIQKIENKIKQDSNLPHPNVTLIKGMQSDSLSFYLYILKVLVYIYINKYRSRRLVWARENLYCNELAVQNEIFHPYDLYVLLVSTTAYRITYRNNLK
jgi:hypothetical protein